MNTEEDIRAKIKKMPLFSNSAMRLLEVTNDPKHDLQDVVKVLEADNVLTAQVLKAVNSAAFALVEPVHSISRAASFLGDKTIVGLAIGHSQGQVYQRELDGYESPAGALWEHSLRAAIAARELAAYTNGVVSPEVAYTAGILHDIGKSVISEFLGGNAKSMLEFTDASQEHDFLGAERDAIGIDHCAAGAELATHWRLPKEFREVCAHHHAPGAAEIHMRPLVYVVHLGDAVAMMGGSATGADGMQYRLDDGYAEFVKMDGDTLSTIMLKVLLEFEKTKSMLAE